MLCSREIGNYSVCHRFHNADGIGILSYHIPRSLADTDKFSAVLFISGSTRLGHDYTLTLNKNNYGCCSEVNSYICTEHDFTAFILYLFSFYVLSPQELCSGFPLHRKATAFWSIR